MLFSICYKVCYVVFFLSLKIKTLNTTIYFVSIVHFDSSFCRLFLKQHIFLQIRKFVLFRFVSVTKTHSIVLCVSLFVIYLFNNKYIGILSVVIYFSFDFDNFGTSGVDNYRTISANDSPPCPVPILPH